MLDLDFGTRWRDLGLAAGTRGGGFPVLSLSLSSPCVRVCRGGVVCGVRVL